MEYFIENQLMLIDLDNLLNGPILENGEDGKDTVIKKVTNKIKEIWEKIKKFFTEKKVEKDIENINKDMNNIKRIEKENPETLANEKENINKKMIFEGISIKDYADALKRFLDHNLDCIRRRNYTDMKKLGSFLNEKQTKVGQNVFKISTAIAIVINTYYFLKGISINTNLRDSVSNLEKRAAAISVKRARHGAVNDITNQLIRDVKSTSGHSNQNVKSKIRDIKQAGKAFKRKEDNIINNALNQELNDTNIALDILKVGLLKFNKIASFVSAAILQFGYMVSHKDKSTLSKKSLKFYNKYEKTKLHDKLASVDLQRMTSKEIYDTLSSTTNRYKDKKFGKQVTDTMNSHYNDASSKFKDYYNGYDNPSKYKSISNNEIVN